MLLLELGGMVRGGCARWFVTALHPHLRVMATTSLETMGPRWPNPVLGSEIRDRTVSLGKSHYGLSTLPT